MTEPPHSALHVAIAGLGTVGAGVLRLLADHRALIAARAGRPIVVTAVSARDRAKARGVPLDGVAWCDDPLDLVDRCDVLVEVIGGAEGPARRLVEAALIAGRPVVTANKALIAHHGMALAETAAERDGSLSFEAAVAGGIPIIKALREGLAGNAISGVAGILNGTCNYILTQMRESGREFADVLAEAQALGYAEADPSFDVDGIDTAHKLAILASLAFGTRIDVDGVKVEGIRHVSAVDIDYARELGYRISLLGIARIGPFGLEQRVRPCMVPLANPIAYVDGVTNAVIVEGDAVGQSVYEGRGAGAGPTASAVVADLVDLARGQRLPAFGVPPDRLVAAPRAPTERQRGAFYMRLMVRDQPGVIADIAAALRDELVSVEAMLQRGRDPGEIVPVVLTVHETEEAAMERAVARIAGLATVVEPPRLIRIIDRI